MCMTCRPANALIGNQYWEFKHPSFSIDMKHSLENIKRKITTAKKPETPGAYVPSQPSNLNPSSSANAAAAGISSQQQQQHKDQIEYLSRQVNILTQNQQQIEGNMEKFTAQYQVGSVARAREPEFIRSIHRLLWRIY